MAEPVAASPKNPPPAPPAGSGLVRQLALVGVLIVLLGTLAADYMVIKPKSEKAKANLDEMVDEKNRAGIKPGEEGVPRDRNAHLVTSNDIHKWMGWGPSKTENHGFHKIEYYNFWGALPLPRHYICVVYQTGKDGAPDMYSSHHLNAKPEDADLPKDPAKIKPPVVDGSKTPPEPPKTREGIPSLNPSNEGEPAKPEPTETPADPAEKPEPSEKPEPKTPDAPAEESKAPATEGDEK